MAADPARATVVADLKGKLDAWQQENPPTPVMEGMEKSQTRERVSKKKRKAK